MDLNNSSSSVEDKDIQPASSPTPEQNSFSFKRLVERNYQIGYLKNSNFIPVTNFAMRCTGYVVDDRSSKSADGFLVQIYQKTDLANESDTLEEYVYFLTVFFCRNNKACERSDVLLDTIS